MRLEVLLRNCNHFADALCRELLGVGIPGYVNRLARIGSLARCCIPKFAGESACESVDGMACACVAARLTKRRKYVVHLAHDCIRQIFLVSYEMLRVN